jgi:membrane carboxypeptidase/penicillin-binding protein
MRSKSAENRHLVPPRRRCLRAARLPGAEVEIVWALELEQRLSKDQILERYLNTIYFGRGAYGIQAASRAYFHKDVTDLTLAESALLAGFMSVRVKPRPWTTG